MKLKLAAVAVASALSFGAHAASATLTNGGLTAVIGDNGVFDPSGAMGLNYNGVEYVNIDNRASWGVLSVGGVNSFQSTNGAWPGTKITNDLGSLTSGPLFGATTTIVSSFGAISMTETVRAVTPNTLSFSWTFTNTGKEAVREVMWSFGFDPDQGGSGKNITTNTILGTGAAAAVQAVDFYGMGRSVILRNTTGAGPVAIAGFIDEKFHGCCGPVTAAEVFAGAQAVGWGNNADQSINLGWNLGTLSANGVAGDTVTIGAHLVFAVPEPETYAMFLAGLGLMGAVVRRRTRA